MVALFCLHLGIEPPDEFRARKYPMIECWIDTSKMEPYEKIKDSIIRNFQSRLHVVSGKLKLKAQFDPTIDDLEKCKSSNINNLFYFYYNGHGVPRPTEEGEIWLFNNNYTQYVPYSIQEIFKIFPSISLMIFDCSYSGRLVQIISNFKRLNICLLSACSENEKLPSHDVFPADIFTCCLISPVEISILWHKHKRFSLFDASMYNQRPHDDGYLLQVINSVTYSLAWINNCRSKFKKFFRNECGFSNIMKNFYLSKRIMKIFGCTPKSVPEFKADRVNWIWSLWDSQLQSHLTLDSIDFFEYCLLSFGFMIKQNYFFERKNLLNCILPILAQSLVYCRANPLRSVLTLSEFLDSSLYDQDDISICGMLTLLTTRETFIRNNFDVMVDILWKLFYRNLVKSDQISNDVIKVLKQSFLKDHRDVTVYLSLMNFIQLNVDACENDALKNLAKNFEPLTIYMKVGHLSYSIRHDSLDSFSQSKHYISTYMLQNIIKIKTSIKSMAIEHIEKAFIVLIKQCKTSTQLFAEILKVFLTCEFFDLCLYLFGIILKYYFCNLNSFKLLQLENSSLNHQKNPDRYILMASIIFKMLILCSYDCFGQISSFSKSIVDEIYISRSDNYPLLYRKIMPLLINPKEHYKTDTSHTMSKKQKLIDIHRNLTGKSNDLHPDSNFRCTCKFLYQTKNDLEFIFFNPSADQICIMTRENQIKFHDLDISENEWIAKLTNIESSISKIDFLKNHNVLVALQENGLLNIYTILENNSKISLTSLFYLGESRFRKNKFCFSLNSTFSHINFTENNDFKILDIMNFHLKFRKSLRNISTTCLIAMNKINDLILLGTSSGGIEIIDCRLNSSTSSSKLSFPEINWMKNIQVSEGIDNSVMATGLDDRSYMIDLRNGRITSSWEDIISLHPNIPLTAR